MLQELLIGVAVILIADIILHVYSLLRKGIIVTTPIKKQLDEILASVKDTNTEQKNQRKDMRKLFELMEAVLVAGQLTAKSCGNHEFNGDLEEATGIINRAIDDRNEYMSEKAFPKE